LSERLQCDCQARHRSLDCSEQLIRCQLQRKDGVNMQGCSSLPEKGVNSAAQQNSRR
jgi:hypothetical protein